MRIAIDLQGVQTESRFRGIGRYSLSFAQAVARNRGAHEIVLVLNGSLSDSIEPIRAAFDGLLSQTGIRVWNAPGPFAEQHSDNDARREVAELVREAYIASLEPDVIHVGSLFEGYVDDAVTSIGRFDRRTPVSVLLHDLIPLLNPEQYLDKNPRYKQYYLRKIAHLERARVCLTNSQFTLREGSQHLQGPSDRFVNVSTAVETRFATIEIGEPERLALLRRFGVDRPFVMYAGGADERKNVPRLIRAFAALPQSLRGSHRLLLAGKMHETSIHEFRRVAKSCGLEPEDLCLTGHVSDDELIRLYNLCRLFVLPSWHEGFGLPALEAMACGAPVVGSNTSSLPEVIGWEAALFDPFDVGAISAKIAQALQDDPFRASLREHGLRQAKQFSWDETARGALEAWSTLCAGQQTYPLLPPFSRKPKLAFVSPLPPERTGIATYSAQLLPALANHYDIDVIVAQERVEDAWIERHCAVRDVAWLRSHAAEYDRVLYQMGNSAFHQHMLPLLREIPGTVVLHDFYLSALMAWLQYHEDIEGAWTDALYAAHGYGALAERFRDAAAAERDYPVNLELLQRACGVIVHSDHARELVRRWCGEFFVARTEVVPLLRPPAGPSGRKAARESLGIGEEEFLVCSFGFLGPGKLNHCLLDAWATVVQAGAGHCRLVFVGETHDPAYQERLRRQIRDHRLSAHVAITGFAAPDLFHQYLNAADMAVQLRADSRGETSAAVLDCMNHGLAVIANANGSMAELPDDAAFLLPHDFDDARLADAIEHLWHSPRRRQELGERARQSIVQHHAPEKCARRYATAIERFQGADAQTTVPCLVHAVAAQEGFRPGAADLVALSRAIAADFPLREPARRLWLDVSVICREDIKTGIQRVVRALLLALLDSPPAGFRVEPVYLCETSGHWAYLGARHYTCGLLDCPPDTLIDDFIEPGCGDILVALDLSHDMLVRAEQAGMFCDFRNRGVRVYAVVFDLLPVLMPEVFPPGSDLPHANWLRSISNFDGALCISKAVADEFANWQQQGIDSTGRRPYRIEWFHLGSDLDQSSPTTGLPSGHLETLAGIGACPSFLMVGTIEPRKGHLEVIQAFEQLWAAGLEVNLVIVGKEGWTILPDEARRTIPETVGRLRPHGESGRRLFWLEGISDEYLEKIYASSDCLIAASYGEGFGLPLIEAARHDLPIIARDIPVFREVAGPHAFYFSARNASELAEAIARWLALYRDERHPTSGGMPWLTWKQSAAQLVQAVCGPEASRGSERPDGKAALPAPPSPPDADSPHRGESAVQAGG